jgi:hypothetical protein
MEDHSTLLIKSGSVGHRRDIMESLGFSARDDVNGAWWEREEKDGALSGQIDRLLSALESAAAAGAVSDRNQCELFVGLFGGVTAGSCIQRNLWSRISRMVERIVFDMYPPSERADNAKQRRRHLEFGLYRGAFGNAVQNRVLLPAAMNLLPEDVTLIAPSGLSTAQSIKALVSAVDADPGHEWWVLLTYASSNGQGGACLEADSISQIAGAGIGMVINLQELL